VIGVLNEASGASAEELPFDLKHRRWPITYRLAKKGWLTRLDTYQSERDAVKKGLVSGLEKALRQALAEPKRGAMRADPDAYAARGLWKRLESEWMRNWWERRRNYVQYEDRSTVRRFQEYVRAAEQPELQFSDAVLNRTHEKLVSALSRFLSVGSVEMVADPNPDLLVSTMKDASNRGRHVEDFDARYEAQDATLESTVDGVWAAWNAYVQELKALYPDVIHEEPTPSVFEERGNSTKHEVALAASEAVHALGDTLRKTIDIWRGWGEVPGNHPQVLERLRADVFPPLEALPIARVKAVFGDAAAGPLNLLKAIAETITLGLDIERGSLAGLTEGLRAAAGYYDLETARARLKDLVNLVAEWAGAYLGTASTPIDDKTLTARATKIYEESEAKLKKSAPA